MEKNKELKEVEVEVLPQPKEYEFWAWVYNFPTDVENTASRPYLSSLWATKEEAIKYTPDNVAARRLVKIVLPSNILEND